MKLVRHVAAASVVGLMVVSGWPSAYAATISYSFSGHLTTVDSGGAGQAATWANMDVNDRVSFGLVVDADAIGTGSSGPNAGNLRYSVLSATVNLPDYGFPIALAGGFPPMPLTVLDREQNGFGQQDAFTLSTFNGDVFFRLFLVGPPNVDVPELRSGALPVTLTLSAYEDQRITIMEDDGDNGCTSFSSGFCVATFAIDTAVVTMSSPTEVTEPASMFVLAAGVIGLGLRRQGFGSGALR